MLEFPGQIGLNRGVAFVLVVACNRFGQENLTANGQRIGQIVLAAPYVPLTISAGTRTNCATTQPRTSEKNSASKSKRSADALGTARIILGHRSAAVTTIYAEADQQKAIEAMIKIG